MTTRPSLKAITDAVDASYGQHQFPIAEARCDEAAIKEADARVARLREEHSRKDTETAAEAAEAAVKQSADLRERHAQLARQDAANAVLAAILRRQSVPFFSSTDAQFVHVFGEALIAVQTAAAVSGVVGGGQ